MKIKTLTSLVLIVFLVGTYLPMFPYSLDTKIASANADTESIPYYDYTNKTI